MLDSGFGGQGSRIPILGLWLSTPHKFTKNNDIILDPFGKSFEILFRDGIHFRWLHASWYRLSLLPMSTKFHAMAVNGYLDFHRIVLKSQRSPNL